MSDGVALEQLLGAAGCINPEAEAALIRRRFRHAGDQEAAVNRRVAGTPLELVLGEAHFAGVYVDVHPGVFIPRRRAECLLHAADEVATHIAAQAASSAPPVALDLGCGTGAVAAAFAARYPDWQLHACDCDEAALRCARSNAERFGFAVHHSDWFCGLPTFLECRIDLVIAHLPYVPTAELPQLPRDYRAVEPLLALDGGTDGLTPWRQVLATHDGWLADRGSLLTQVASHQGVPALVAAREAGLSARLLEYDDAVVIVATR